MAKKKPASLPASGSEAKKDSAGDVNKSLEIRKMLKKHPEAAPREIAEKLQAKDIEVAPAYVSMIKFNMKKKGGAAPKRRGPSKRTEAAASTAASTTAPRAKASSSPDRMSIKDLLAAKKLAQQLGGVEKAKELLNALSLLQ